ncbi:hypothetical protein NWF32_27455 [Pseudomonas qingdaonensis]|nr:hypothetical protein [Pseudomonas qingdaonensis]
MAVVAAGQLIGEVVEGIEDWEVGDRELAMAHLQSVALNIAFAVGLGLALKPLAVGPGSELLEGTVQIRLANGQYRLWKPQLEPYAADVDLSGSCRTFRALQRGRQDLHPCAGPRLRGGRHRSGPVPGPPSSR